MKTNNRISVLAGDESFKKSLAAIIRLSGVDPEEVPSLSWDVLRDEFDLPVEVVYAQLVQMNLL
jgi:RNAse (barnase) inhibitor barstar